MTSNQQNNSQPTNHLNTMIAGHARKMASEIALLADAIEKASPIVHQGEVTNSQLGWLINSVLQWDLMAACDLASQLTGDEVDPYEDISRNAG